MELVDYVRSEIPNVPFDATYVLITSYYVTARWTKQPFTRALKEDRDLVRMGSEALTTVSARRENLRRLVMETFPTMAFQRVLVRMGLLGNSVAPGAGSFPVPPQPSEQLPQSPVIPDVPSEASRPCPLCGSAEHSYYAGHYTHTGPITRKTCSASRALPRLRARFPGFARASPASRALPRLRARFPGFARASPASCALPRLSEQQ
ncbi:hypothetical protein CYMTET_13685 [Cymbomonas tetramitiformis]|uniref:Uncharacterized protein n=1 Tax=Cymbomonas tetramitiformis TaxID=36881 RepID=A0AAE0LAM5_9CHLO|nr:hypothetical protein CYMTET_13685 [Cymbomonas tetramitiformis]